VLGQQIRADRSECTARYPP